MSFGIRSFWIMLFGIMSLGLLSFVIMPFTYWRCIQLLFSKDDLVSSLTSCCSSPITQIFAAERPVSLQSVSKKQIWFHLENITFFNGLHSKKQILCKLLKTVYCFVYISEAIPDISKIPKKLILAWPYLLPVQIKNKYNLQPKNPTKIFSVKKITKCFKLCAVTL